MNITILDALPQTETGRRMRSLLEAAGHACITHRLADERFAPCQGCWECWVDHPGTCKAKDAANDVMRDLVQAETVLWITRPRFGCWDPIAKSALDKTIGLLSPFFQTIEGETHHLRRYEHYPQWWVLAETSDESSDNERQEFTKLVARNTLNMHSCSPCVVFVEPEAPLGTLARMLDRFEQGHSWYDVDRSPPAPFAPRLEPEGVSPGKAVLWVGSAKPPRKSTSESYGGALLERLHARGWSTETVHLASKVRLGESEAPELLRSLEGADLLILSTPVYIDCVPALVLAALEHLVDSPPERLGVLPIVQCGFPERSHTNLALEILENAARELGLKWVGHLAASEGGAVDGAEIKANGRLHKKAFALDEAANLLTEGAPLNSDVIDAFGAPILSPALYRTLGQVGWLASALKHGAIAHMWDRPFAQDNRP